MKRNMISVMGALSLLVLCGARGKGCEPKPVPCEERADCAAGQFCDHGFCSDVGACEVAADCDGQALNHDTCEGYYVCEKQSCEYQCGAAPQQGEACGAGDACAEGLTCLHYYGIAGPSGPEFISCEIPCANGETCPAGQACVTIADGPGEVCRAVATSCDPSTDQSCGPDLVCVSPAISEPGSCEAFSAGQQVGAGYKCGPSIGVSCADGLFCKGLPTGVIGGNGVCTLMQCEDWTEEYNALVDAMSACTTADECVDIPGTSCGCTRNVVLNQNADLVRFQELITAMADAGCLMATTCDCPAADGFVCDHGHCGWNYL